MLYQKITHKGSFMSLSEVAHKMNETHGNTCISNVCKILLTFAQRLRTYM
jgi:hypothetical protein